MAQNFYTILTNIGKAKMANAYALGTKLNLTTLAVGDGSGAYYEPTEDQTALKNQVWSGNISGINVDPQNSNWIKINAVIPTTDGGFTIREAGAFDDSGNLIAVGKYPETYKPQLSEGSSKDLNINMILEFSNTATVTLKVDPTAILATKKDITDLQDQINNITIPVTKVNNKTGEVVLKADDIKAEDGTTLEQVKESFESYSAENTKQFNDLKADNANLLPVDVTKFGAVGDGLTDCLSAFNSAVQSKYDYITSRLQNPNLTIDSDVNDVADGWTVYTDNNITGDLSNSSDGQKIQVTSNTSGSQGGKAIYQDFAVSSGEAITVGITHKSVANSGTFDTCILVYTTSGVNIGNKPLGVSENFTNGSYTFTVPDGCKSIRLYIMARAESVGALGEITVRNVTLQLVSNSYTIFKFPQNTLGNAVYYFSTNPDLSNKNIDADVGVKLSFASTNAVSFKTTKFYNDIEIISRDRNNIGLQYKNNYSDLVYNAMSQNDLKIGVKTLIAIMDGNISKKIYSAGGGASTSATLSLDSYGMYYMENTGDIANDTSKVITNEFIFDVNKMYFCDFELATAETNNFVGIGITTSLDDSHFSFHFLKIDGKFYNNERIDSAWNDLGSNSKFVSIFTDAYKLKTGLIFAVRPIGNNMIEIYLNGVYIQTVTLSFAFNKIGFGMIAVNAANQGLQNTKWGRIVGGLCTKSNYGNALNIVTFGDSITFGEGSISWAELLPKMLSGQKGLNKVSVTNYASSGNRASEQLTVMQSKNLSSYDIVLILIGTNDIQMATDLVTFQSNIQSMITLANANGRKVVLGIPYMFISQALTGVGFASANYEKGAAYRSILMYLAATNGIYVADTLSEIGRIGVDNTINILRDNLHVNEFGQIALARCFTRSILSTLTNDL